MSRPRATYKRLTCLFSYLPPVYLPPTYRLTYLPTYHLSTETAPLPFKLCNEVSGLSNPPTPILVAGTVGREGLGGLGVSGRVYPFPKSVGPSACRRRCGPESSDQKTGGVAERTDVVVRGRVGVPCPGGDPRLGSGGCTRGLPSFLTDPVKRTGGSFVVGPPRCLDSKTSPPCRRSWVPGRDRCASTTPVLPRGNPSDDDGWWA